MSAGQLNFYCTLLSDHSSDCELRPTADRGLRTSVSPIRPLILLLTHGVLARQLKLLAQSHPAEAHPLRLHPLQLTAASSVAHFLRTRLLQLLLPATECSAVVLQLRSLRCLGLLCELP
jgi:hypothetical protein